MLFVIKMTQNTKETRLYGLVEGIFGKHIIDKDIQEVLGMLPKEIRYKCSIEGTSIKCYSPCDG